MRASVSDGSTRSPTRRAGSTIALLQLVAPHRADEHLVRADQPCEPVVRRAAPVEVGAHGHHHLDAPVAVPPPGRRARPGIRPLALVAAEREQPPRTGRRPAPPARPRCGSARSSAGQRMRAGAHQSLGQRSEPGSTPARQRRQQARPHRRGLSAAGRADHGKERRAHEPGDELRHEPLATEEVLRVRGIEGGEPEERANRRQRRGVLLASVEPAALVERPEGEQVAGEIGLGRAQLAALEWRRGRRSLRPPARPGPRPLLRRAMHGTRGRRRSPRRGPRSGAARAPAGRYRRAISAMASSPSGPSSSARSRQAASAEGGSGRACRTTSSSGRPVLLRPSAAARSSSVAAGVVGVVDDEQRRALALLRTPNRGERVAGVGAAPV